MMINPSRFRSRLIPAISAVLVVLLAPALQGPLQGQVLLQSENPMLQAPEDHHVVFYPQQEPLLDSRLLTLKGQPTATGVCQFAFPVLTLGPDEEVVQARQISTDYTDCTTVVEIGIPIGDAPDPLAKTEGESETLEAVAEGGPQGGVDLVPPGELRREIAAASGTSSAYYRVWWEDIVNWRVNEAKSNIAWSYNGSCVTSASGSLTPYWLTTTGWTKTYSGVWITTGCSSRKVYSVVIYKNGAFCWPGDVFTYYNNVTVRGTATNGLSGWYDATWTDSPIGCPPLHFHTELRRVTGF